jgi:hypothetical protein
MNEAEVGTSANQLICIKTALSIVTWYVRVIHSSSMYRLQFVLTYNAEYRRPRSCFLLSGGGQHKAFSEYILCDAVWRSLRVRQVQRRMRIRNEYPSCIWSELSYTDFAVWVNGIMRFSFGIRWRRHFVEETKQVTCPSRRVTMVTMKPTHHSACSRPPAVGRKQE